MSDTTVNQSALQYKKARESLLAVAGFTALNLLLSVINSGFSLLFSATVPQMVYEIGREIGKELHSSAYMITGLVLALILVAFYFLAWYLARRFRIWMLIAFILFIVDSLLLMLLVLINGAFETYILDIIFHALILYFLFRGVSAWRQLRGVSDDDFSASLKKVTVSEEAILAQAGEPSPEDSKPRKDDATLNDEGQDRV